MSIRVVLIDDHEVVRAGLRDAFKRDANIRCVGEAGTGADGIEIVSACQPDVVLIDMELPDMPGSAVIRAIRRYTKSAVIVFSGYARPGYVRQAMEAGAAGYVSKSCALSEIKRAVEIVAGGSEYFDVKITGNVVAMQSGRQSRGQREIDMLSDQERRVLSLLGSGKTVKETAAILHVKPTTVYTHRQHAMEKCGLRNDAELIRFAIKEGLVGTL